MAAIILNDFRGMMPRRSHRLLPQNYAEEAINCELLTGSLYGFHQLEFLHDFGVPTKYAYRIPNDPDDLWLGFDSFFADVVRSPLVNDAHERYYFTEPGEDARYNTKARIEAGDPSYRLGVPRPTQQPIVVPTDIVTLELVTRAYTYAFVTGLGEVGPAADPTVATGTDGVQWDISNIQAVPPDNVDRDITHVNIYRTITSTSGVATYFFVDQITIGTTVYADVISTADVSLNEQYRGFNWFPPVAEMQGIIRLPNGSMAGFVGDNVYFSEPYRPHAWPPEYTLSVDYPVVGFGITQNYLVICTESRPYIAMGTHPARLALAQSAGIEPCLSKTSIISSPEGVYYASQNGLVLLSTQGLQVITTMVITRNEWSGNYNPESIKAARLGTRIIAFEDTPGTGFVLDPAEEGGAISNLEGFGDGVNALVDAWNGEVLVVANEQVFQWDVVGTSRFPFTWKSKEFQIPEPLNFAVLMLHYGPAPLIDGIPDPEGPENPTDETVRVRIWAGPNLIFDEEVKDRTQRRLPSGFKEDAWQVEVSGNVELHSIALAETGKELASV